jgi:hypothetical protein
MNGLDADSVWHTQGRGLHIRRFLFFPLENLITFAIWNTKFMYLTQGTPVNAVRLEKYIEGAVWPECSLFIAAGKYSNRCACEGWTHTSLTMKLLIQPVNESCSMNKLPRRAATCSVTVITGGQQLYGNNQAVALYCSSLQIRRKPKGAAN